MLLLFSSDFCVMEDVMQIVFYKKHEANHTSAFYFVICLLRND